MHFKPSQLVVFILIMGPLVWASQAMGLGETGTFTCVVIGLVLAFVLSRSSKHLGRKAKGLFQGTQKGAAADFMFAPSSADAYHSGYQQMRRQIGGQVGQYNAPRTGLPNRQPATPLLPHPQRRPGSPETPGSAEYIPPYLPPTPSRVQLNPPSNRSIGNFSPQSKGGPRLHLGPDAIMPLQTSLTGALIIDGNRRRAVSPVFLEEWAKLGLGLLVVDLYGDYIPYLGSLPRGYLAGSSREEAQDRLTTHQQTRYMAIDSGRDATHLGQTIVNEQLQVIYSASSYRSGTDAGTCLLALLAGMEQQARKETQKACAVLITDSRWFCPATEEDCIIENEGLAQQTYDLIVRMLEQAGKPTLPRLAMYLATPSVIGMEEETLEACQLWVTSTTADTEIEAVAHHLELAKREIEPLKDGEVLLYNEQNRTTTFSLFRRAGITLSKPEALPSQLQLQSEQPAPQEITGELVVPEDMEGNLIGETPGEVMGEMPGLKMTKEV